MLACEMVFAELGFALKYDAHNDGSKLSVESARSLHAKAANAATELVDSMRAIRSLLPKRVEATT